MINQLLDDPKLTARKYREWKVMNTLLIQDIYQQHQQRRTPTSASEGSPRNHLPLPALKILFENKPGCSPLLSYPSGNSSRRCKSLTFFLAKEN